jgi:hypothetical protein
VTGAGSENYGGQTSAEKARQQLEIFKKHVFRRYTRKKILMSHQCDDSSLFVQLPISALKKRVFGI